MTHRPKSFRLPLADVNVLQDPHFFWELFGGSELPAVDIVRDVTEGVKGVGAEQSVTARVPVQTRFPETELGQEGGIGSDVT